MSCQWGLRGLQAMCMRCLVGDENLITFFGSVMEAICCKTKYNVASS